MDLNFKEDFMDNKEKSTITNLNFNKSYLLDGFSIPINKEKKYFALIIYDIENNKTRRRIVEVLESYGERVQKSAFEVMLRPTKFNELLKRLKKIPDENDSIRVYKIQKNSSVEIFGEKSQLAIEHTIII